MSFKLTDTDNGSKAFFKGLASLKKSRVKIGIQSKEGAQIRQGGITMVHVAAIHEFGSPVANIPQRSFLRSTADENRRKYDALLIKIVRRLSDSPKTFASGAQLFRLGEIVRADIINKLRSNIPPPLAESTIGARPKEDPATLIDTGQMLNSIRSVVE